MGKYLDALQNFSMSDYNFSTNVLKNDTISPALELGKNKTNDNLGIGIITFLYFMIFITIVKPENAFNVSPIQAFISTSALIFSLAYFLLFIGLMSSIQYFLWTIVILFLVLIIGTMRSSS